MVDAVVPTASYVPCLVTLACVYSKLIAVATAAKGRSSSAGVFREPHSLVQGVQFSGIQPQLHIVAPRTTFERGSYERKVSPHEFRRWMISSRLGFRSARVRVPDVAAVRC